MWHISSRWLNAVPCIISLKLTICGILSAGGWTLFLASLWSWRSVFFSEPVTELPVPLSDTSTPRPFRLSSLSLASRVRSFSSSSATGEPKTAATQTARTMSFACILSLWSNYNKYYTIYEKYWCWYAVGEILVNLYRIMWVSNDVCLLVSIDCLINTSNYV